MMLLISFLISITWVAFAAGFNSNPSFQITQLYPYELCWFTRDVIYYFLTIPACVFISINIITFILVGIRIINHARNATSPHHSYERMKRCVLVLLSSCITQGIGWLFGPFITILNPTAGNILGWFFIIFNGLEGFWSILVYIIIRSKHVDEPKRVKASRQIKKMEKGISDKYKKSFIEIDKNRSEVSEREAEVEYRNTKDKIPHLFDDLRDIKSISWPNDDDIITSAF
jgi:hypothetical protein